MAQGLKILFLVSNDHYTDQRMQRICQTLTQAGFEVTLLGRYLDNPMKKYNYKVVLLPLKYRSGPMFYLHLMKSQVAKALHLKDFDFVSTVDTDTLWAGKTIAKELSIKHIHDAHEWFTEVPELIGKKFKKRIWSWIENKCLPLISAGYTVTEPIADFYSMVSGVPFQLIKNYPLKKEVLELPKMYDVIYTGAINKGRCLQHLVSASIKFGFSVCICGSGDEFKEVQNMAKGNDHIKVLGAIKPEDLHAFNCKSRIGFNVFEILGKSYDASLSNKTFDYIQAGIPQLLTDAKVVGAMNKKKPFALIADENNIGEKVMELLENQTLYASLQANVFDLKEEWIWEKQEKTLIDIYKNA